ncbi:MAG: hypothetical protein LUF68_05980, partial [Clostridiales bacterium]|nr:hypothetical protein [Clostridiales bacterium]
MRADEVECRISEIDRQGRFLRLLLYKTVRTDAALLDETFGTQNWQDDYKVVDGRLFCGIGVRDNNDNWIWRWNVGTESNMEAKKGEASDAMKRAGFLWGIGTELYSAPEIKVSASDCHIKEYNGKYRCYDRFDVAAIGYDEREDINALTITCNGRVCYQMGAKPKAEAQKHTQKAETPSAP